MLFWCQKYTHIIYSRTLLHTYAQTYTHKHILTHTHTDKEMFGRMIKVEFATYIEPPGGFGRGGRGGGGGGRGGGGGFRGGGRGGFHDQDRGGDGGGWGGRGRGRGGGGRGGGGMRGGGGGEQPNFTPASGDWVCPDPK